MRSGLMLRGGFAIRLIYSCNVNRALYPAEDALRRFNMLDLIDYGRIMVGWFDSLY
jgi:hypothetical protein